MAIPLAVWWTLGALGALALAIHISQTRARPFPIPISCDTTDQPKRRIAGPCERKLMECVEQYANALRISSKERERRRTECFDVYVECTTPGGIPIWPQDKLPIM